MDLDELKAKLGINAVRAFYLFALGANIWAAHKAIQKLTDLHLLGQMAESNVMGLEDILQLLNDNN